MSTSHVSTGDAYADQDVFPASFGQERMWFLGQLEPDNSASYHVHSAVRLRGHLDPVALQNALNLVIGRHESLRTGLATIDGELQQIVWPEALLTLPVLDRSSVAAADRLSDARRAIARELRRPFTLDSPPLLRAALLHFAPDDHVLLVVMHHIVCDGWSVQVFLRELTAVYAAHADDRPAQLPELTIQYADYAVWQREQLSGAGLDALVAHWRDRLNGAQPLELPTDALRPSVRTSTGARVTGRIGDDVAAALHKVAGEAHATLFMTLLAVYAVVLHNRTGQDDIVVGSPVSNRGRAEVANLVGLIANTLVLRTDTGGDPTFRELLDRVRAGCLDAYAHQELPFEKLVEELRPARDLSRSPLFQVLFALQPSPLDGVSLPGLELSAVDYESGQAQFDLALTATDGGDGIGLSLEYNVDLFEAGSAQSLIHHMAYTAGAVGMAPDIPLSQLDLLGAEERAAVTAWGTGAVHEVPDATVAELVAARAARHPDAVAVESGNHVLTYRDLTDRVESLAAHLAPLHQGAAPVGVFLERSVDLVVALLAVLRSKGTYLPLDPRYPRERLAYMLSTAQAGVVVASAATAAMVPPGPWQVTDIGAQRPPAADPVPATHHDAGYVIFTSGSTGRPKGVRVEERSLVNHLLAMAREVGCDETDVLTAVTSPSFDIAALELFLPLVTGARLVIADEAQAVDGEALAQLLDTSGTTLMQATPATWRQLLAADWSPRSDLRMLCGGEVLDAELAARLLTADDGRLWNLYGPTEATIWVSAAEVRSAGAVNLGRPLANTTRHVLDRWLRPVPVGAVGELYVGGAALAWGYLGRPGETAERFVPDPFSATPGGRLYRTGDLGRYRVDGALEFLGRADTQIKVRGFRVEPAEIEAVLATHPDVDRATVVAHQVSADDIRLVAHVVTGSEAADTHALSAELRTAAAERLPDYMVPNAFVFPAALPLTPAGKVDRAALAAELPDAVPQENTQPRTDVEHRLAAIFTELLGVPRIGVHTSFFDIGGHSLLATRLIGRIKDEFSVPVALQELFQDATIAAVGQLVADRLRSSRAGRDDSALRGLVASLSDEEVDALLSRAAAPTAGRGTTSTAQEAQS